MTFQERSDEITGNAQKLRYTKDNLKNRRVVYYGTGTQAVAAINRFAREFGI
jgi:hypothetical protein